MLFWVRGVKFELLCVFFLKNASSKERVKTYFFVTFTIITSHIFSEISLKVFKAFRKYEDFVFVNRSAIFINLL